MPDAVKPVVVIGSLNMDLVARCQHLPLPGQTVFGRDFFTAPGGKGANQAVAAAKLGASVAMAGCVGQDQFGRDLVTGLRVGGIDVDSIRVVEGPTGTALITIDAAGANTIVVISGANTACDSALVDRVLARTQHPGILLLQQEIPPAANTYAIREARANGWFIILNPAPAQPLVQDLLPLIDIIAPNETEAAAIVGRPVTSRTDALAAARHLLAQGVSAALVTLGGDGAIYCDSTTALHCPAVAVQAVDTTAAGDAYIGALAAALAVGRSMPDGLGYAAAAAGLSVTRLGAQPSLGSSDEVADFIARYGAPAPESLRV